MKGEKVSRTKRGMNNKTFNRRRLIWIKRLRKQGRDIIEKQEGWYGISQKGQLRCWVPHWTDREAETR